MKRKKKKIPRKNRFKAVSNQQIIKVDLDYVNEETGDDLRGERYYLVTKLTQTRKTKSKLVLELFIQSILAYQQEHQKSWAELVKEIDIQSLTEKKLIDICCGKLSGFSLGELLIYANNLRITIIPCYQCGVNLFPALL